jgi:hypothetical protein
MSAIQNYRFKVGDRVTFRSTGRRYEVTEISHRGYELQIIGGGKGWDPVDCQDNYDLDEEYVIDRVLEKYADDEASF